MPAIQHNRLKAQLDQLAWLYTRPAEFCRSLNDLLERCADPTYRPGQAIAAPALTPAYRIPPLVMRQMEIALTGWGEQNPDAALATIEALWSQTYLEPRLLAAFALGQLPVQPPDPILSRLRSWIPQEGEPALQTALLERGSLRMRREMPNPWLALLNDWIINPPTQSLALRAFPPLARDPEFINLPAVYSLLGQVLPQSLPELHNDLVNALLALFQRAPGETSYLLRQTLASHPTTNLQRLTRRLLPDLPPNTQSSLRPFLTTAGN